MPEPSELITVVIPTYNRLSLLKEAVNSVIAQTFSDWELIVADDGSQDETISYINSLEDKRIKLLSLIHCGNIAAVRNAGANAGSGKWIAFLDSDDVWVRNRLEIQLNILKQNKKRWSYGGFEFINEKGETIQRKSDEYRPVSGWIIKPLLANDVAVDLGALILERKLFSEIGGFDADPRLFCREDYEITLRLALKAEVVAVPNVLYKIREHSARTTKTLENGYELSAYVYEHFISTCNDKELKRIAQHELAHELAEASVKNFNHGNRVKALKQLFSAAKNGDALRHLLSSLQHYFFKRK
jgi:glycosyltransferase involved in cell wall biosynthesis